MAKLFTSPFLNVASLKKPIELTIAKVVQEEIGRDREAKDVAYFEEIEQAHVLKRTDKEALIDATPSGDTEEMVGLRVQAYVDPNIEMSGKRVGGVRLKVLGK